MLKNCFNTTRMKIVLEPKIRLDLIHRHKTERDKRIADRIKAVLLSDEGWSVSEIAHALFLREGCIRDHLKRYAEDSSICPKHKGSSSILSCEESKSLSDHLENNVYTRIKEIRCYVQSRYQKTIAIPTLYRWLKANGFSYKKPKIVPKNINYEEQESFKKFYHNLMNEASLRNEPVLFGDSVHPSQQIRPSYGWLKRGKDKPIASTGARKRVNIMGALSLETMKFTYDSFDKINTDTAIDFLKKLEDDYPKAHRIHLIWDQAGYHISDEVKAYIKNSRVHVHYLPPRSPNLNPIERLWKIMHEYVSNNRVYKRFKDFQISLFHFFDETMCNITEILVRRITDNFQTIVRK